MAWRKWLSPSLSPQRLSSLGGRLPTMSYSLGRFLISLFLAYLSTTSKRDVFGRRTNIMTDVSRLFSLNNSIRLGFNDSHGPVLMFSPKYWPQFVIFVCHFSTPLERDGWYQILTQNVAEERFREFPHTTTMRVVCKDVRYESVSIPTAQPLFLQFYLSWVCEVHRLDPTYLPLESTAKFPIRLDNRVAQE